MDYEKVIVAVAIGIGVVIAKALEPVIKLIKSLFDNKEKCHDDTHEPATKGDLKIMKLEILKEVDETTPSKTEFNEVRGKLESMSAIMNNINTNTAVMAEQIKNMQESISVVFRKIGG